MLKYFPKPCLISGTSQTDPVLQSIDKFSKHPSIINIKKRMNNSNYKFSFKSETQEKFPKLIQNLNCNNATQQYDICIKILKENSEIFSYILCHNFNNSQFSKVFPISLKKADITPVYKKDEKFLKNNYRPVSILPSVSKIYERYIYDQINNYFYSLSSKLQCGFRKEFNAQHCLLLLVEKCREVLDKRGYAGILLTDLSKAFNCINHEQLIAKLHAYGFSLESLTFIQSYLTNRIQRVKMNSSFSEYINVESGVPQGSISGPLFFNIFICDLFFHDIDIDLANCADGTTPYAYDLELDKVIQSLEKNIDKLFHWFSDNFLKANPDKCHLLINTDENVTLKIKNETITSSSNEKLLGILFNNKFDFDEHVTSLCRKASQKLNALARVAQYTNLAQRRLIMNAFIFLQFGYCPLVLMFHSRKLNNLLNNIHERALRIVYRDYESTFQQLLKQNKSVSIHQRNLQILATEIFKTKNGLNPVIMEDVFNFKNLAYNFRNVESLNRSNISSVKYATETITSLGAKIWKILPNDYKEVTSLSTFKSKINNWETDKCHCRLCKTYIQRVGFI